MEEQYCTADQNSIDKCIGINCSIIIPTTSHIQGVPGGMCQTQLLYQPQHIYRCPRRNVSNSIIIPTTAHIQGVPGGMCQTQLLYQPLHIYRVSQEECAKLNYYTNHCTYTGCPRRNVPNSIIIPTTAHIQGVPGGMCQTQLLYQLLHIYKIYNIYTLKH